MSPSSLRTIKIFVALSSICLLAGCGGRLGDFTVLTSKQFNAPVSSMVKGGRVTGEDCSTRVMFFTFGHVNPSVKSAVDQAIEKESANALVDAVVEWNQINLIVFGSNCFTVTGTAAKIQ